MDKYGHILHSITKEHLFAFSMIHIAAELGWHMQTFQVTHIWQDFPAFF